jgi:hypothetical protein
MTRSAAIEKAQIHRRLVQRYAAVVGADVRPCAVIRVEGDADFRIRRIVEFEFEIGVLRPPQCLFSRSGLLGCRAAHEAHAQRRAVHPQFADGHNRTRSAAHAQGVLRTHLVGG